MEYILIFISAIFVNNIILSQFLGICPFLGVSKKVDTALGMGAAVAFVLTLATVVTYLLQIYVLNPFGLQYLQTLSFHPRHRSLGSDGRDCIEESVASPLPGTRHLPSSYHHQLCCAWCSNPRYPKRLLFGSQHCLRFLYRHWLCFGNGSLRRFARAALFGSHP